MKIKKLLVGLGLLGVVYGAWAASEYTVNVGGINAYVLKCIAGAGSLAVSDSNAGYYISGFTRDGYNLQIIFGVNDGKDDAFKNQLSSAITVEFADGALTSKYIMKIHKNPGDSILNNTVTASTLVDGDTKPISCNLTD